MGNQPSSPTPPHSQSRSDSGIPNLAQQALQKSSGSGLKTHRSLRKRNRSIELPDLDPTSVLTSTNSRRVSAHGLPAPGPSSPSPSSRKRPVGSSPIPIGGLDPRSRTDSDAERLLGGDYGTHIPPEVVERATRASKQSSGSSSEQRQHQSRREPDHRKMESLLAQVVRRTRLPHSDSQTDESSSQPSQNPNEVYRRDPSPSPPPPSPPHTPSGEIFHSRLRFGLDRHVLMRSGLIPRSDTFEAALVADAESSQALTGPPEAVIDPITGTVLAADERSTTPVQIKYTDEPCEGVILCLSNSGVVGLGIDVKDAGFNEEDLGGREADGLYVMDKITDESGHTVFSKTLHLLPGTHHMRFLVSNVASASTVSTPLASPEQSTASNSPASGTAPNTPTSKSSFLVPKVSASLPTSPDPSGQLSNFVVVAVPNSLAAESKDILTPLAKPAIQIPERLKNRLLDMERSRGREAGHSFWSKDSEPDGDDDGPPHLNAAVQLEELNRKREERMERWTSEIPEELQAAAQQEEAYLSSFPSQDTGGSGQNSTQQISGFTPAPPIPPAPIIPRHLDKLILNYRPPTHGRGHARDSSPSGGGSPTRGGHRAGGSEREGHSRYHSSRLRDPAAIQEEGGNELERKLIIPVTTASGTDVTSSALLSTTSNAAAALTTASSFLSSSGVTSPWKPLTSSRGHDPRSSQHYLQPSSLSSVPGTRQVDLMSSSAFSDDASVLPVPSHVVLNHLSTSAIRNGVLAVGSTLRYKDKYLTAIYYKPT